jgi:hypothetical protein
MAGTTYTAYYDAVDALVDMAEQQSLEHLNAAHQVSWLGSSTAGHHHSRP